MAAPNSNAAVDQLLADLLSSDDEDVDQGHQMPPAVGELVGVVHDDDVEIKVR